MGGATTCSVCRLSRDQLARDVRSWNGESKVVTARVRQVRTLAKPVAPTQCQRVGD
jgi:hypothetical protein